MNRTASKIGLIFFILLALASIFVLRPVLSSVDTYAHQIEQLDRKRGNVLALANASAITSALITAIPDDTATPIAEQLAELSKTFVFILAVLMAEKYLLTVFGILSSVLIFIGSVMGFLYCWLKEAPRFLLELTIKLIILAIAFGTLIPCSVMVTDKIEKTYEASIKGVVNNALTSEYELQNEESGKNIFQQLVDKVTQAFTAVTKMGEKLKAILGRFIEASAVMLVTSCVVPILVLVLYLAGIKFLFGIQSFGYEDAAKRHLYRLTRRPAGRLHGTAPRLRG